MRTWWWVVALAIVVVYGVYGFVTLDRRGDEEIIRSAIDSAAAAAQNRDPGGVMACVSPDYRDEAGTNYDRLRLFVAQSVRSNIDYNLSANIDSVRIDGDEAVAEVSVRVVNTLGGAALYDHKLTVHLEKRRARHALVFPTTVWRVVGVKNLGIDMESL